MTMASLSPSSVLASPIQVNPQVKSDLQASVPQVAQDAQKASIAAQTDTITFSVQALKMTNGKNVATKKTDNKADKRQALQSIKDKAVAVKNTR